jgi:signal transduction histidine kinase
LLEVPVFVDGAEREWVLAELDVEYAVTKWLPELIKTYIESAGAGTFQPLVRWSRNPGEAIYGNQITVKQADAEASFFPLRFLGGGGGRRVEGGRWKISLSHAEGSVPAAVQAARWRNLAIAFVPLLLIATAGVALVRNSRRAQRLAAAQYQFFAGISHELRTPLTVIQGAGHNLLTGIVKDEAQRESYAQAIVKQSTQLREMVDQLLSYGAETRSPSPIEASSASLDIAVSEAIDATALELEQSGRAVDVDMPPDLPLVRGDQTTLRRILGNLISNAIRHGGGEVAVSAARIGSTVEVRVADSGEGIAAEELSQVFDPFFRGKRARTGRTRGTGLGLSLVKESVERLGGTVSVESQLGKGTVFVVKLPVAE